MFYNDYPQSPDSALNVEEVGGRRERPERPKAHSLGHRPRSVGEVLSPCKAKAFIFIMAFALTGRIY